MAHARHPVYVSSAEVYGRPPSNPVDEATVPNPTSPYGASKLAAEAFVRAHAVAQDLSTIILRPFSVYGPGQPAGQPSLS